MTEEQKSKCQKIIHSHAIAGAAGNAVPIPGVGAATDMVTMATMAMALSAVFGKSIPENVAKSMAIASIKKTMLKQPIKVLGKELSKVIPFLGSAVAPALSAGIIEAAGWALANDMDRKD